MRHFLGILLLALPAFADTVFLKNGSKMDGTIASEDDSTIALHVQGGATMTLKIDDVDHVELTDRTAAQAELKKRRGKESPQELLAAARWGAFHGLKNDVLALLKEVLKADPDNEEAHSLLGHHHQDGKWLSEDEYQQSTGHVKRNGKWVTAEEAAKLDEEAKQAGSAKPNPKGDPQKDPKKPAVENLADPAEDKAVLAAYGLTWRAHCGKRYRLVTNCKDPDPRFDEKLVQAMDAQWDVYCGFFGVQPEQKKLHNIVVFASRDEYDNWCVLKEPVGKGAFGVFSVGNPFQPASLGYRDGLRAALFTARHEGCHQFYECHIGHPTAPWAVEGVACFFEGDIPLNEYPYRWDVVRQDLVSGKHSLADVIEKSDKMQFDRVYGMGAAICWFFQEKGGAYKAGFQKLLQGREHNSADALAKLCGAPIDAIQKDFTAWLTEKDRHAK